MDFTIYARGLFEPFTQVSQGRSRKFGGTGLGLSVSQRFVKGMGREIGVRVN
ncbi:MAG: ATP-binding protein [Candidatus Poribacteria bacterium]|nr:ATP-binding protein [Candidatus Poribacteria bacterium]MDP6746817.1 ATP-binding protein [Candidatus Poribacteria bacterium]MDP6994633.1 ATP-binding protein [Candidatus Poribacteria bacterium]